MAINRIAVGSAAEFGQADALKAALAEFISVLIFVFAGEGSGMAFSKSPSPFPNSFYVTFVQTYYILSYCKSKLYTSSTDLNDLC